MENDAGSHEPVVICLQQDVDVEWYPVITDGQQLDHEVVTLVQEDATSQHLTGAEQVSAVNCVEVVPDFLVPDKTAPNGGINYHLDDDGQIVYITYAWPGTAETEWQSESPSVVQNETVSGEVKPQQSILHVTEDGNTVLLNVGSVVNGVNFAINGTEQGNTLNLNPNFTEKHKPARKRGKKQFPSEKVEKSLLGNNLCIEEKLQIVDAMLTPAPKRTSKKKDKPDTASGAKDIGLSYICIHCSASFSEEKEYYCHLVMHIGEQEEQSAALKEQSEFATDETVKKLGKEAHTVLRRYICPQCPAAFSHMSQLSSHQQHAHLGERPHKCQICKKSFYKRSDLRSHLNIHLGISKSVCEICGRMFSHVSNLIRHSRIHTGVKPYPCSVCGRRFSQLNGLHQHKTIHQDNRDINCTLCPKTFKSYSIMRRHMRCSHVDKLSSMGKEANRALQMKGNTQSRRFYCKVCGESFKFAALLKHHESLHAKESKFHCKFCKKDFMSTEEMKTHYCEVNCGNTTSTNEDTQLQYNSINGQTPGEILIYITGEDSTGGKEIHIKEVLVHNDCASVENVVISEEANKSACTNDIVENVTAWNHIEQNHNLDESLRKTPLKEQESVEQDTPELLKNVGLRRSSPEKLELKEPEAKQEKNTSPERIRNKSNRLREAINDLLTPDKRTLPNDIKSKIRIKLKSKNMKQKRKEKNERNKKVSESSSPKSAEKKWPIENFIISESLEVVDEVDKNGSKVKRKVYNCPECSKKFNKNSNFQQHLGVHYMDLMKHACPSCGQCFAWKSTLNRHIIKMHRKTPPKSSCEYCGKEYPLAVQVQEHIKRDHLKQRPHVCSTCNKTFYKKHDLNVHQRTHTREKPYICGTCSKSFSHLSHIIRHERIHTGVRPYKCFDCDREFIQSTSLKLHRQLHMKAAKKTEIGNSQIAQEVNNENKVDN